MTTTNELRSGLTALAKRSVSIMTACANEESAKLYLALPFLGLLGYDYANPYEVYPDHIADRDPAGLARADLAVLRDGLPVIALEVKRSGLDLIAQRSELRAYFNAMPSVKLAILTNGVLFEFFVDSDAPSVMDADPFMTLDLETAARAGAADEIVEALASMTKTSFDPDAIAETAHVRLVKKRLRSVIIEEAHAPSEDFCRFALRRIGIASAPLAAIDRHYAPMIKSALAESLGQNIDSTERELALLAYVRRRLAYLADDEMQFAAIDAVRAADYLGKLVVFYDRERKGRLFDFIEGRDGYDKFVFPEPIGEIVTNSLAAIDSALKAVFTTRLRELGVRSPQTHTLSMAQSA